MMKSLIIIFATIFSTSAFSQGKIEIQFNHKNQVVGCKRFKTTISITNSGKTNFMLVPRFFPAESDPSWHRQKDRFILRAYLYDFKDSLLVVPTVFIQYKKQIPPSDSRWDFPTNIFMIEAGESKNLKLKLSLDEYGKLSEGCYRLVVEYYGGESIPYFTGKGKIKNLLSDNPDLKIYQGTAKSDTLQFYLKKRFLGLF